MIRAWTARAWALALALLAASLGAGCFATETGNPPSVITSTTIMAEHLPADPTLPSPPMIALHGQPGAISPPEGVVFAWALSNNLPPESAEVAPDGSFALTLATLPDAQVRLQVRRAGDGWSAPLDLFVSAEGVVTVVTRASPCVSVYPGDLVALGPDRTRAVLRIQNDCDARIVRSEARLRVGGGELALTDDGQLVVPPGGVSQLELELTGPDAIGDDIVLFSIVEPARELIAVTVLPFE